MSSSVGARALTILRNITTQCGGSSGAATLQRTLPPSEFRSLRRYYQTNLQLVSMIEDGEVDERNARELLRALLISMPAEQCASLDTTILSDIDALLADELSAKTVTDVATLPRFWTNEKKNASVALWQGDMSLLRVDAVVNPNNGMLLGCFEPSHRCLDNILHAQAGPRLRIACKELKEREGIEYEDNGKCRVTPAFALPAKYMYQTVGPALEHGQTIPTPVQVAELRSCYVSCLEAARGSRGAVRSVAFCCISTGIFGYPQADACRLACQTVKEWMMAHENEDDVVDLTVVFNVFLDSDRAIYEQVMPQVFGTQKQ